MRVGENAKMSVNRVIYRHIVYYFVQIFLIRKKVLLDTKIIEKADNKDTGFLSTKYPSKGIQ